MWPEVTGRLFCKRLHDAEDWCGVPSAVLTRTLGALGLMFAHGALGIKYIELAPISAIAVYNGGRSARGISVGSILGCGVTTIGDAAGITRGGI